MRQNLRIRKAFLFDGFTAAAFFGFQSIFEFAYSRIPVLIQDIQPILLSRIQSVILRLDFNEHTFDPNCVGIVA